MESIDWLNYHHLYYFRAIAECGSMSEASRRLRLGQPTLSLQLKQLEEKIGILFERRNRRLVLTERGRVVLRYAQDIFARGDELKRVVERGELSDQRTLTIGAQEGVPKAIIGGTMVRLRAVTNARLDVREGSAGKLFEELTLGRLDIVISDHRFVQFSSVTFLPVANEKMALWSSRILKKELKGSFPQLLNSRPIILPTAGHPLRQKLEQFFLQEGLVPQIVAEVPDTALIKELGVQGAGIIALGETTVRTWVEAGRLVKVGDLPFDQRYWLAVPRKDLRDPLGEKIIKEFRRN
jgi:LysR family transcriptional activator of nhaA